MSGAVQLAILSALGYALSAAFLVAIAWPKVRTWLVSTEPTQRASRLFGFAVAPALVGTLVAVACLLPGVLGHVGLGTDHCPLHDDLHAHLCVVHGPASVSWVVSGLLGVAGLVGLWHLGTHVREAVRTRRWLGALTGVSSEKGLRGVRVVTTSVPISLSAGLLRKKIFVSSRLVQELTARELDVVLEHERAHLRRGDGALWLLASALTLVYPPPVRRSLLSEFHLACEQACDEEAAARVGDRTEVAAVVVAVERLLASHGPPVPLAGPSFGGSSVVRRVESLLDHARPSVGQRRLRAVLLPALVVLLVTLADPLHHFTENALSFLAR